MALDVTKLAETLGLDESQKQRLERVAANSDDFRHMLEDVLDVKATVDAQKEAVMSFLASAELFLGEAAEFARSQGVDEARLDAIMAGSKGARVERADEVFTQAREFRRLGDEVAASRSGGLTQLEADAENQRFEDNYKTEIRGRIVTLSTAQFGPDETPKIMAYVDELKDPLRAAVSSGDAAQIQPAIKTVTEAVVQRILNEADPAKKVAVKDKLPLLKFKIDQLCSMICIASLHASGDAVADLPMHEAMLLAIMKRAPDEAVMAEIKADYKKLATLGNHHSVKVKLANGQAVSFYMENGEEKEIPAAVAAGNIIDVDTLKDSDMNAAIAQMSEVDKLTTTLVAPVAGIGAAGDEIVIRGTPGFDLNFSVEKVGSVTLDAAMRRQLKDEISKNPMKYLHRDFRIN